MMRDLNAAIAEAERKTEDSYRAELMEKQGQLNLELAAHDSESAKPKAVPKPQGTSPEEIALGKQLEQLREKLRLSEAAAKALADEDKELVKKHQASLKLLERLKNLVINLRERFKKMSQEEFVALGIKYEDVVSVVISGDVVNPARLDVENRRATIARSLDETVGGTVAAEIAETKAHIGGFQTRLDAPGQAYAKYLAELAAWTKRRLEIVGAPDIPNTLSNIQARIAELDRLPTELKELYKRRLRTSLEILRL